MGSYYLVDYENVGASLKACAIPDDAQVLVFLGQTQMRLRKSICTWLGRRGEYITMEGAGPNALDFQISMYVGMLVKENRDSTIVVISKDKGFDPMLRHLKKLGYNANRMEPSQQQETGPVNA